MAAAKLWFVAALLAAGGAWAQGANGLIVQLRDAPTHEQRGREQPLALRDDSRWQQVLDAAGVRATASRPSGASARLLQFGPGRLTRAQAQALAERLQRRPEVAWVVPNERERRLQVNNPSPIDPLFGDQWWLHPVGGSDGVVLGQRLRGVPGFQTAWMRNTGSPAARVAVLDTGITSHPELVDRFVGGYDFVSDLAVANDGDGRDADPSDPGDWVSSEDVKTDDFRDCTVENSSWHGTLIAGIVAARTNEREGVAAANWDGRIVPVRVAGKCGADVHDIVEGMRWAAGLPVPGAPPNPHPARIINLSFGGTGPCDAYQSTINELLTHGVVVVAAAGNERTTPTRPAKCPGAIGVAAVNRDGFKTNYSNFGPTLAIATVGGDDKEGLWGDLFADGGLLTIYNGSETTLDPAKHTHAYLFGTSFATPVVAGALSLMLSVNPALSAKDLIDGLALSARPHVTSPHIGVCSSVNPWRCLCTTSTCGAGLLDVEQALLYAAAPTSYVAPAWTPAVLNNSQTATAAARGADSGSSPPAPPPAGGGGGGGAMQPAWLLALALATVLLWRRRRG